MLVDLPRLLMLFTMPRFRGLSNTAGTTRDSWYVSTIVFERPLALIRCTAYVLTMARLQSYSRLQVLTRFSSHSFLDLSKPWSQMKSCNAPTLNIHCQIVISKKDDRRDERLLPPCPLRSHICHSTTTTRLPHLQPERLWEGIAFNGGNSEICWNRRRTITTTI